MQSSPANVRTFASDGAYWRRFASCAPSLVTTWMSTGTLAAAPDEKNAAPTNGAAITASADLGLIEPPLPRGSNWLAGDRSPGFRTPDLAPSQRCCGIRQWPSARPPSGHSGGTAPASHRTSLDHRPL